jgi:hypothetical protein
MQRPPLGGARAPAVGEDLAGHVLRTLRTQTFGFVTTLSGRLPIMNWRRRIGPRPGRKSLRPLFVAAGFNAVPHVGQQLSYRLSFASGLDERRNELDPAQDRQHQDQRSRVGVARRRRRGELSAMSLAIPATRSGGATVFDFRSKASDSPTAIGNRPKSQSNSMAQDIRTQNTTLRKGPPIMQPEAVGWSARQLMQGNFQAHVVLYGHE